MFTSLLIGIGFWFAMALTPFLFIPLKILQLFKQDEAAWVYLTKLAKAYTWTIFKVARVKLEVSGLEKIPDSRHLCIVSNHQAFADIITIMAILPRVAGYIAKKELGKIPFLNQWMTEIGCYFMDRHNVRDGLNAILFGVKRIKEGYPMVIFPEGTRSKGKAMNEFKKGSLKLATKSKALVVPLSINGTYKLLEATGRIQSCVIQIIIHDPVDTTQLTAEQEDQLSDQLWNTINQGVLALQGQANG